MTGHSMWDVRFFIPHPRPASAPRVSAELLCAKALLLFCVSHPAVGDNPVGVY
jgi:hypothetical protein